MKMDLGFSFFDQHLDLKRPILLGLSGGPDSICLLHLALDYKLPIEIVHVNHGWRQESRSECEILQKLAAQLSLAFTLPR